MLQGTLNKDTPHIGVGPQNSGMLQGTLNKETPHIGVGPQKSCMSCMGTFMKDTKLSQ